MGPAPTWTSLGRRARAWRGVHAVWSVAQLGALAYTWRCVLTRRRDGPLRGSVAFLLAEGVGLVIGRGSCPMAGAQESWGDPVPLFELVLPPRAAKAAVPALGVVTVAALVGLLVRPPAVVCAVS